MADKYYKLGKDVNSFSDPITKLKLVPGMPGVIVEGSKKTNSRNLEKALRKGKVVLIPKEEAEALKAKTIERTKIATSKKNVITELATTSLGNALDLRDLSKNALMDKVKALPDISEEEVKKVSKFNKDAIIDYLTKAEEGDEDDDEDDDEDEDEED